MSRRRWRSCWWLVRADGVWARRVAVDYASHSAAVEELREELLEALEGIEPVVLWCAVLLDRDRWVP